MNSSGVCQFEHSEQPRIGVLLCNLGSPAAPTTTAVRKYLRQFLSDRRVIDLPRWFWLPLLHAIILRTRPAKSARLYAKIWGEAGSPLLVSTASLRDGVAQQLQAQYGACVEVEMAMRYGEPSIEAGLERLRAAQVEKLVVLPLYPQYSATTTATTFDEISRVLRGWRWLPELRFVSGYHDYPPYLDAVANSIASGWREAGQPEQLLFSFHGLPQRYFTAGDPYHCLCHYTAREVASRLRLSDEKWSVAFQSRFGREEWLRPYTTEVLEQLGSDGAARVDVVSPGFAVDCLETLEEIEQEHRALFLKAGGGEFNYINALNDSEEHVLALSALIEQQLHGWPIPLRSEAALRASHQRALELGAKQ